MTNDEVDYLFSCSLFAGGCVHFGRQRKHGGMQAGTLPLVARIEVLPSQEISTYPSGWFPLDRSYGIIRVRKDFPAEGGAFLPEWLLLACYRYHYEALLRLQNAKSGF